MNRGDRREDIFLDDEDRERFLETLEEACAKSDWRIHAYCLMGNHFHLVLETPSPTLVVGMKWMLETYTQRFNTRHRLRRHLFAGRYKALIVDEADALYLRIVCDYVHLNPARARLVAEDMALSEFRWSSYPSYLVAARQRPKWLRVDRVLGEHGIGRDDGRGRREFSRRMEAQRLDCRDDALESRIRRGWQFGGEDFLDRLRDRMGPAVAGRHESAYVRETMAGRARRIVDEELAELEIEPRGLETLPKGALIKIHIARRLRRSTTLTLKEIAVLLHARSWRTLANALSRSNVSK